MKSLFDQDTHQEIKDRLQSLTPDSERKWGKMTVAQMLHHCQQPLLIGLEKITIEKPPFIMGLIMKMVKSSLHNDKPWKKGLPTAKEFIVDTDKDFLKEKETLALLIDEFHQLKTKETWKPHPIFGKFTKEEWGKMQYKHLDHHFTQFSN
ncbi:DUF1569 domain-containing protein [Mesonia sp.]|uniref:DUF1569 domain-containing protein n=1 Tax=Mesonia sp. TaxID=1960830 RepID=UPI00175AB8B6|nr:DUF1569 domain-containing protein [Mesonia sp.]HIB37014.1 DUF1569 domain-containing protein [Mesonia sp.]HIO27389.1 DUF1569 domain-containing protein [Flavobacteriaceae bacterium]